VDGKDGDFQTSPIDPSASCGGLGIGDRDTHDILFPYFIVHSVLSVQVPYLPSGNYAGLDAADATYWLARLQVDSAPVVLGTLPPQRKDPGDCTRAELAAIIKNTL
jgi:hypothetical protein